MPNYCANKVYFVGDEACIAQLVADMTNERGKIDFRRARPMPKELSGVQFPVQIVSQQEWDQAVKEREAAITRRHQRPSADDYATYLADRNQRRAALAARPTQPPEGDADAAEFLADIEDYELQGPDLTYEQWAQQVFDDTHIPALPLTKTMSDEYKRRFRHDNWYDWQNANWGTERGPFDIEPMLSESMQPFAGFADGAHPLTGEPRAAYSYCSAGGPCHELFRYISELYPDIAIVHTYNSCASWFRGIFVFINGVIARDECIEYESCEEENDERGKSNWKEEGF